MSLIHKEKKSTPHRVKDAEVSRALEGVYKELNALKESVNNFKSKKEDDNTEGKEGDIRVVKSSGKEGYNLQIRGDTGWLEDKTAKYVGLKATVNIAEEQKKPTVPKSVGGLHPVPDWNSGWIAFSPPITTDTPMSVAHPLKALPINYVIQFAPWQPTTGNATTSSGYNGVNGEAVDDSEIKFYTNLSHSGKGYASADFGVAMVNSEGFFFWPGESNITISHIIGKTYTFGSNVSHTACTQGSVRILAWK